MKLKLMLFCSFFFLIGCYGTTSWLEDKPLVKEIYTLKQQQAASRFQRKMNQCFTGNNFCRSRVRIALVGNSCRARLNKCVRQAHKQDKKIENRKTEHAARGKVTLLCHDLDGEQQHAASHHSGRCTVSWTGNAKHQRRETYGHKQDGINQDTTLRCRFS